MTTRPIACFEPRSTRSHCGSLNYDDQRVLMFPSTAAEAGSVLFSTEEAVAVPVRRASHSASVCAAGLQPATKPIARGIVFQTLVNGRKSKFE